MISIFHGNDKETHKRFQAWRKANVDGYHMTESSPGLLIIHYTQDKRENPSGRGCIHQGGSDNDFREDKGSCYTTARKVCSENFSELIRWAKENGFTTKNCKHCDSTWFPFPTVVPHQIHKSEKVTNSGQLIEQAGSVAAEKHFVSYHNAEKMGYSFEEADPFSVGTKKSVKRLLGQRVWSISGYGRPRQYYLREVWIVEKVGSSEQDEMINVACGHGTVIKQPVLLNELPWFQDFLKSQSNFSLGLQQIKGKYIPYFEALLASLEPAPGWPAVVAGPVERVDTFVCRIIRDTQLAEHIKSLHNHQCQICGYTIIMPDGSRYAEGHHIQPLGAPHDGPDTGDNILCLCPNHHVICDKGAMRLSLDDLRKVDGHAISQQFLDYHNRVMYRGNAWSLGDS